MWYKKEGERWLTANTVVLPTNGNEIGYGWTWHDEPPREFIKWQEEEEEKFKKMTDGRE